MAFKRILFTLTLWVLAPFVWAQNSVGPEPVGSVSFAVGVSQVLRGGKSIPAFKGMPVLVGDQIETSANGHIHIQFVDHARVSVRPDSKLLVEVYDFNVAHPELSSVKFSLTQGVMRAISGDAAHAARNKFRLNTPLVAIGVRGTDFTTLVNSRSSAVLVNEGAVVLAPFGGDCTAASSGPCAGAHSRVLTAVMNQVALVYRAGLPNPIFQPLNGVTGSEQLAPLLKPERENIVSSTNSSSSSSATPSGATSASASSASASVSLGSDVASAKAPTSTIALTGLLSSVNELFWGRWPTNAVPGDGLTQSFASAMASGDVTVGDGYYFLFRSPTSAAMPNLLPGLQGQASFALQSSSAYFTSNANGQPSAVTVLGGTLGMNFSQDSFSTSLNLSSNQTGNQSLSVSGALSTNNGIFIGTNAASGAHVAGALSFDALQAGYLFSMPVQNGLTGGSLSGATLWGRK